MLTYFTFFGDIRRKGFNVMGKGTQAGTGKMFIALYIITVSCMSVSSLSIYPSTILTALHRAKLRASQSRIEPQNSRTVPQYTIFRIPASEENRT